MRIGNTHYMPIRITFFSQYALHNTYYIFQYALHNTYYIFTWDTHYIFQPNTLHANTHYIFQPEKCNTYYVMRIEKCTAYYVKRIGKCYAYYVMRIEKCTAYHVMRIGNTHYMRSQSSAYTWSVDLAVSRQNSCPRTHVDVAVSCQSTWSCIGWSLWSDEIGAYFFTKQMLMWQFYDAFVWGYVPTKQEGESLHIDASAF